MRKFKKKKKKFAATKLASCIAFCSVNSCCPANAVFPKLQAYLFTFSVVRANYYMQLHWSVSLEKKYVSSSPLKGEEQEKLLTGSIGIDYPMLLCSLQTWQSL